MNLSQTISAILKSQFTLASSEEKFGSAEFQLTAEAISLPEMADLKSLLDDFPANDKYTIHLKLGSSNEITFQSPGSASELYEQIKGQLPFYTTREPVVFKLSITKINMDSGINIYHLDTFISYLQSLSLEDALINFSDCIANTGSVTFYCKEIASPISSGTISFLPWGSAPQTKGLSLKEREELLRKISSNCSLSISNRIVLLPNDFHIPQIPEKQASLQTLFNRLSSCLLTGCIFDSILVSANTITHRLNGYKSFTGTITLSAPFTSINEYYSIYEWIYAGGGLADKIGLARNILSLNFLNPSSLELNLNTYHSLLSAHKVYEKQNIKQYIELRNKVTDQVYAFNDRANKIIEAFAAGFQKSAIAFVTLFSTIVVTRVLTTREFNNIFSYDAAIISLLFLTGSLIYFFISLWEVNAQLARFRSAYQNMKQRNEDLLLTEDINKILNKDKEHNDDLDFIRRKRRLYSFMWLSFLALFLAATLYLHNEYGKLKPNERNLFNQKNATVPNSLSQPLKAPDSTIKATGLPKDTSRHTLDSTSK